MKAKTLKILLLLMCCLTMASCDSNKGKIEEKTKQFVESMNSNDVPPYTTCIPTPSWPDT